MARIPGGTFLIGNEDSQANVGDGEGPVREVSVSPFLIDTRAVTNTQFAAFVKATRFITDAERFGWSYVFHAAMDPQTLQATKGQVSEAPWWHAVEHATWSAPEGPGSSIDRRPNHPVVHVSFNDASGYAAWRGKRLPTEAEWEISARGALVQTRYPWGNELLRRGRHRCNIWQGTFPSVNTRADGYLTTAPVNSFEPNAYGLYCVAGNVWEWCSDWFSVDWHARDAAETRIDPKGPPTGLGRVIRGGSYLCHDSYCNRYRVAARTSNTPDSSTGHMGFRCAADV